VKEIGFVTSGAIVSTGRLLHLKLEGVAFAQWVTFEFRPLLRQLTVEGCDVTLVLFWRILGIWQAMAALHQTPN